MNTMVLKLKLSHFSCSGSTKGDVTYMVFIQELVEVNP